MHGENASKHKLKYMTIHLSFLLIWKDIYTTWPAKHMTIRHDTSLIKPKKDTGSRMVDACRSPRATQEQWVQRRLYSKAWPLWWCTGKELHPGPQALRGPGSTSPSHPRRFRRARALRVGRHMRPALAYRSGTWMMEP